MLITNARIATMGQAATMIENGAVRIQDGIIADMGSTAALRKLYPTDRALDASGQLLLPGAICAHTHFYGAFVRGMG